MKFVTFGPRNRVGLLVNDRILDLAIAAGAHTLGGDAWVATFGSLQGLIESGSHGLDIVGRLADKLAGADQPSLWLDAAETSLNAPWPGQRFFLAGSNNPSHQSEAFTNMGDALTVEEAREKGRALPPSGFWGQARPIMGPDADIQIPKRANGYFDFEAEPGIILGKQGKDIKASDGAAYVWGVTLVADWSIRIPEWPPKPNPPFMPVKNFDCSKSIGPCIVVGEVDADDFMLSTIVNGTVRQHFSSNEMIYSFAEILEYYSRDFTFFPGDVIAGGTGAGTAIDQTKPNADRSWPVDLFLKPGDEVEIKGEGIGSLVSRITAP